MLTELQARIAALETRPAEIIAQDAGTILIPKKPKRKAPKPRNTQVSISIPVKNEDGILSDVRTVILPRFNKKRHKTEALAREMVSEGEELLRQNDVPVTNKNLRLLGLGSRITNKYRSNSMSHTIRPAVGPNQ